MSHGHDHGHGAEETKASTPDVKQSGAIQKIAISIAAIFLLFFFQKMITVEKSSTEYGNKRSMDVYDFSETEYNNYFVLEIEPGKKARVDLTSDYCPIESSSKISVYDERGYKRVHQGYVWIKGVALTNNSTYTFFNESSKNVTIKIGRFLDEAAYASYLNSHKK